MLFRIHRVQRRRLRKGTYRKRLVRQRFKRWYIAKAIDNSKDGTTIKKIDDDDNAYLVLNNGSTVGNYVRLYQRVAVKKNGIYKVPRA